MKPAQPDQPDADHADSRRNAAENRSDAERADSCRNTTENGFAAEYAAYVRNTAGAPAGGLLHAEVTHRILGCFFKVHWRLGYGFLESVYANALAVEFRRRRIAVEREAPLAVQYEGENVGLFRADFVVEQRVLVEIKSVERLVAAHEAQIINYLHTTGIQVGLLLNFGPRAVFRRLVATRQAGRDRGNQQNK